MLRPRRRSAAGSSRSRAATRIAAAGASPAAGARSGTADSAAGRAKRPAGTPRIAASRPSAPTTSVRRCSRHRRRRADGRAAQHRPHAADRHGRARPRSEPTASATGEGRSRRRAKPPRASPTCCPTWPAGATWPRWSGRRRSRVGSGQRGVPRLPTDAEVGPGAATGAPPALAAVLVVRRRTAGIRTRPARRPASTPVFGLGRASATSAAPTCSEVCSVWPSPRPPHRSPTAARSVVPPRGTIPPTTARNRTNWQGGDDVRGVTPAWHHALPSNKQ